MFIKNKIVISFFIFASLTKMKAQLVDLAILSDDFDYEIRYATPHNFMGEQLYDCAKCLLQYEVAEALINANAYFWEQGYKIKIYDCYRPLSTQQKMWAKVPNPSYVANPYGKGSVHNRGAAVDVTLVSLDGCYLEMGSDYDYFGKEAHLDYKKLPEQILANRALLQMGMRKFGFNTIRTEWWHFSYKTNYKYNITNTLLPCN